MSFFKYHNETKDSDGLPLWWPGGPEGYPVRGNKPNNTTDAEFEKLKLNGKFKCKTFYLSKPEDNTKYIDVRDKASNGLFVVVDRDRQWDEDSKDYRIYLEWVELAYELPPSTPVGGIDAVQEYTKNAKTIMPYSRLAGVNKDGW